MQRRLQFNTANPRSATSRATAVPYICFMVCCTAIRLLRDDPVARLFGSIASSASYLIIRKPRCCPRRAIVFESTSPLRCISHCTHTSAVACTEGRYLSRLRQSCASKPAASNFGRIHEFTRKLPSDVKIAFKPSVDVDLLDHLALSQ